MSDQQRTVTLLNPRDCEHNTVRGRWPYDGTADCLGCGYRVWLNVKIEPPLVSPYAPGGNGSLEAGS